MTTDSTKAMEEALQAAVKKLNGGGAAGPTSGMDAIGLIASILPRLMAGGDGREELLDKIEGLQKDDIGALRVQVRVLRKKLHRVLKVQERTLEQLRDLEKQQSAVTIAVLKLAGEMARVQIIEAPEAGGNDDRARPSAGKDQRTPAAGDGRRVEEGTAKK